jgi:DNA-binding transcriptional ArsR family regulator|tara:strand:+ start:262 stop:804 length:543 start_codon:yes stop_codon:yes gene_type:complete
MSDVESLNETPESHLRLGDPGKENHNFVQLSRAYLSQMRALARKSPVAHEILYYLVEHMGRTTNAVVCSYKTLCEMTGVSRPTVGRAIKLLKEDNWIDTIKIGNANAYCVNERVFWQAARNQRQYAVFSATVIATSSEQESNFREKSKHKLRHIPFIEDADTAITGTDELPPPDQKDLDL